MNEQFFGQYAGTREVECTHLICAIVKKDLLKKLKLPINIGDNPFIDADYCLEASKLGFKTYATTEITVQYGGMDREVVSEYNYGKNFDKEYDIFNEKWGRIYDHKLRLPVMYHTSMAQPSGFATVARGYMKGLSENNIAVSYNFLRGTNEEEGDSDDLIMNSISEHHGDLEMPQVIWGQAPYFVKNSGKYKIGHCEFEGESMPAEWLNNCNSMDELWVPTKWDREKFRNGGVEVPIHVIGQGIDKNYFHPDYAPARWGLDKKFIFLCNAAWDPRKNLPNLIRAFQLEFSSAESVCLKIKTMNMGLTRGIKEELKEIKTSKSAATVIVKEDEFKPEQMGSFYTSGSCFILPTHGEAWGLPIFEALACGIPVITTDYGAPAEELRNEEGEALPGVHFIRKQMTATDTPYVYLQGNHWAEPSIPHMQELMRYVFTNAEKEKEKARLTSDLIRSVYDWKEIVKPIIARLEDIYKNKM